MLFESKCDTLLFFVSQAKEPKVNYLIHLQESRDGWS
jgi:hypothetical protein